MPLNENSDKSCWGTEQHKGSMQWFVDGTASYMHITVVPFHSPSYSYVAGLNEYMNSYGSIYMLIELIHFVTKKSGVRRAT